MNFEKISAVTGRTRHRFGMKNGTPTAALWRSQHTDCATKFNQGWSDIVRLSKDGALGQIQYIALEESCRTWGGDISYHTTV